jgi:hypothetical protein
LSKCSFKNECFAKLVRKKKSKLTLLQFLVEVTLEILVGKKSESIYPKTMNYVIYDIPTTQTENPT